MIVNVEQYGAGAAGHQGVKSSQLAGAAQGSVNGVSGCGCGQGDGATQSTGNACNYPNLCCFSKAHGLQN
jgi:hypothetical protein